MAFKLIEAAQAYVSACGPCDGQFSVDWLIFLDE